MHCTGQYFQPEVAMSPKTHYICHNIVFSPDKNGCQAIIGAQMYLIPLSQHLLKSNLYIHDTVCLNSKINNELTKMTTFVRCTGLRLTRSLVILARTLQFSSAAILLYTSLVC